MFTTDPIGPLGGGVRLETHEIEESTFYMGQILPGAGKPYWNQGMIAYIFKGTATRDAPTFIKILSFKKGETFTIADVGSLGPMTRHRYVEGTLTYIFET